MTTRDRLFLAVLLVDSMVLAVLELLYLPLRFDGWLLPDLNGFPLPVSALVAALTLPLLVHLSGRLSTRTSVAAAPLLVWLLCIGVFGLMGPGGDLVLTEDWRALLLLAGGALPAAYMLGGSRG
ncbi:hypothetical protein [Actinophytocola sp.]|uniref:hypothetical protein n=1 Tax=Actinophytocola sp. TaxID=1872138 RepID=UPI002D810C4B|nr:hypothetical protein [Actinophytocola sp.]HET9138608.1 hypothetical protein [Actinophytocola sp.]HEU5109586.1 hypothetical protein [Micromonosporaceae bacterium]